MPALKVVHVANIDWSLRNLLFSQLRSLKEAGYEVIGISAPGSGMPLIESSSFRHITVPMTRNFTPFADLHSLWRLYRVMRRERPAIVHTHTPKPGLLGQLAARMAGVPVVVNTLHGFYFHDQTPRLHRRFYISMERIAAYCSDRIFSQNSEDVETAIREHICTQNKISLLGNGIDLACFNRARIAEHSLIQKKLEWNIPDDALVLGFVGRLVREKGVLELLQALRLVVSRHPNVRMLIIGPIDKEKGDVLTPEVAHAYGVGEICIFTGYQIDLPQWYALMGVFVLPSHREGFPRSVMEASAMGVPCIVTDIRGCREAVEHKRNGLRVPKGDVPALADAIAGLLSDPDTRNLMGKEGRRIAIERFDEIKVFDKIKCEYARLLCAKNLVPRRDVVPTVGANMAESKARGKGQ